jgi:hypothetical protein
VNEQRLRLGVILSAAALGVSLIVAGIAITRATTPPDCYPDPAPASPAATRTSWVTVTENEQGFPYIERTVMPEDLDR